VIRGFDDAEGASAVRCVIDRDLTRTLIWTKALVEHFCTKNAGRIVTTAAAAGLFGLRDAATFSAVGGAIAGLTRSYALTLRGTDVRVNAVAPILNKDSGGAVVDEMSVLDVHRYSADAVAPVVGFLCCAECQITGQVLSVAAGRTARTFCGTAAGFFDAEADHVEIQKNLSQILSVDHPVMLDDSRDELLLIEV
jgi:NAD(P)-dependent dehydrogenase (short-subunit alcohol dehydrogenase family)